MCNLCIFKGIVRYRTEKYNSKRVFGLHSHEKLKKYWVGSKGRSLSLVRTTLLSTLSAGAPRNAPSRLSCRTCSGISSSSRKKKPHGLEITNVILEDIDKVLYVTSASAHMAVPECSLCGQALASAFTKCTPAHPLFKFSCLNVYGTTSNGNLRSLLHNG